MPVRPENEEPEGPDLPPIKSATIIAKQTVNKISEIKGSKYIELKGILGASASLMILISYLLYYYFYYNDGIKLNELYFISSGIGISVFTGLLFTFFRNVYVRTALLFTSVFYLMLELTYVIVWIFLGQPYTHIKLSLIIGLIIGITYFGYDKFNNKSIDNNN